MRENLLLIQTNGVGFKKCNNQFATLATISAVKNLPIKV